MKYEITKDELLSVARVVTLLRVPSMVTDDELLESRVDLHIVVERVLGRHGMRAKGRAIIRECIEGGWS